MFFSSPPAPPPTLQLTQATLVLRIVRSMCARRYLLRLDDDGAARLVIPRRGSQAEALRFLERSHAWLERRHAQWRTSRAARPSWQDGAVILFRGQPEVLRITDDSAGTRIAFADQTVLVAGPTPDPRAAVQFHLRTLAEQELPGRVREWAAIHGIKIGRILIRAQKTRWGSCSAAGTISLNWRLVQAPPFVRDYLIVHELMHRREMNHSARYWRHVADAFPRWQEAEAWLKKMRLEMLG